MLLRTVTGAVTGMAGRGICNHVVCGDSAQGGSYENWPATLLWNDHLTRAQSASMAKVELRLNSLKPPLNGLFVLKPVAFEG